MPAKRQIIQVQIRSSRILLALCCCQVLLVAFIADVGIADGRTMRQTAQAPNPVQGPIQDEAVPEAAKSAFLRARDAESRSDWKTAEDEYKKALEAAPTWAKAIVNLGIVYNRLGDVDGAIKAFKQATEIDPKFFGAHLNLAITYFKAQRYAEAEAPARAALAIQPANAQATSLLLLSLFAEDKHSEVAELAEKLMVSTPEDPMLLELAGRSYFKLHDYKNTVRVLEKRVTFKPEGAELYLALGEALDNIRESEKAIVALKKAIALSVNAPLADAHFDLGYIYWKQREFDEAEKEFRAELAREPSHAPSTYYLGNIALERGDVKTALPLLKQAALAIPEDFAIHYDLGKALLQSNQIQEAIEQLSAAIRIDAKQPDAHYQLGLALKRANRDSEASQEFDAVRKLNEEHRKDLEQKVQGEQKKQP
jgi:tetratricopeptide (TPR) repeat protein